MEKLSGWVRVDFVPMRRTSVLLLLSLRTLEENQDLMSCKQSDREDGGWFGGQVELGVIRVAMKVDVVFTEDIAKRK